MSHSNASRKRSPIQILFEYSAFLIVGAVAALVWANLDSESHHNFFHADLTMLAKGDAGDAEGHGDGSHGDVSHGPANGHDDAGHDAADNDDAENDAAENDAADNDAADNDDSESDDAVDSDDAGQNGDTGSGSDGEHADEVADDQSGAGADDESPPGEAGAHGSDGNGGSHHAFSLYFIINDLLMAFFFAIAGKEVWESLLPGGALSNPKKAATPLMATLGGIVGPAVIYLGGVFMFSSWGELGSGWAIPCATDIAFSYLVARLIFGQGHPAIAFLLLLAIADDAAGLMIIALFYSNELHPMWLLLTVGAIVSGIVMQRVFKLHSFWWYLLIPGTMSWVSFLQAGIHPALGLVPIIPIMPHAHSDLGIFARDELKRTDALNSFEHWWKNPVEVFLGLFGLCNAGVAFSSAGTATWLVLAGLLIGKPLGITLFTFIAHKGFRLEVPKGMGYREIVTLGSIAGIGFTVALFVSGVAFPGAGQTVALDAAKMGALASFGAALMSFAIAFILKVPKWSEADGLAMLDDQSSADDATSHAVHRANENDSAAVDAELGAPSPLP